MKMMVSFPPNPQQEVRALPRNLPAPFSSSWLTLTVAGSCQSLTTSLTEINPREKSVCPSSTSPPPKGIAAVKMSPSKFLLQSEEGSCPRAASRAGFDPGSPFPPWHCQTLAGQAQPCCRWMLCNKAALVANCPFPMCKC